MFYFLLAATPSTARPPPPWLVGLDPHFNFTQFESTSPPKKSLPEVPHRPEETKNTDITHVDDEHIQKVKQTYPDIQVDVEIDLTEDEIDNEVIHPEVQTTPAPETTTKKTVSTISTTSRPTTKSTTTTTTTSTTTTTQQPSSSIIYDIEDNLIPGASPHNGVCSPVEYRGIKWNWARNGDVVKADCPGGATGQARWRCSDNQWVPKYPDLSQCKSAWLNSLETRLEDGDSIVSIGTDLAQVSASKNLYGGDILSASSMLTELAKRPTGDRAQILALAKELLGTCLATAGFLLSSHQERAWDDLSPYLQRQAANQLLLGLEENAFVLVDAINEEAYAVQSTDNIYLSLHVVDIQRAPHPMYFPTEEEVSLWPASAEVQVFIPTEALLGNSDDSGYTRLVFFVYHNIGRILSPQRHSRRNISTIVNSHVVSASLGRGRHIELPEPVHITFKMIQTENVTNPQCVWWDYTLR